MGHNFVHVHLCYFDADIGEFITRDQKWGKISSPTTLDRYTYCGNNPELGRFLTRDPLKGQIIVPQTLNPYSYCLNNPLKYTGPDGRDSIRCDEEKYAEPVIQGSYVPQLIGYEDVNDNYLRNYEEEWGLRISHVNFNLDGTYTVVFFDGNDNTITKKFKCEDGYWMEIPLESGGSGDASGGSENRSVPPGYLPPAITWT